jgi:hypothetical protein
MNMEVTELKRSAEARGGIFDCDIHPKSSASTLMGAAVIKRRWARRNMSHHWPRGGMIQVILYAVAGVFVPTLAWTVELEMATVASGVNSEIKTHWRYDRECRATRIDIRILAAPANGTASSAPKKLVVPAESPRGGKQSCAGKTIEGVAVYYQSKPGFVGQDSFRYLRFNPNNAADRLNGEITYTITVK